MRRFILFPSLPFSLFESLSSVVSGNNMNSTHFIGLFIGSNEANVSLSTVLGYGKHLLDVTSL